MTEAVNLTLRKSDWLDDWYVIERAEHDGRTWLEPIPGGLAFMCSARLGDADIEGTAAEMLAIADAIETNRSVSFRRCAARREGTGYLLGSPRNSVKFTAVRLADAMALAAIIRAAVTPDHGRRR
jgi:hypothetical protein